MAWLFKFRSTKRLFLLCPTWFLEPKLRKEYKDNPFFLTSLGGSFSFDRIQIQQIKSLVCDKGVRKICIVANPQCKFIQNIIKPESLYSTTTEELLAKIYHKKYDDIQNEKSFKDKCLRLSILHAEFQIAVLRSKPDISSLFEDYNLEISIVINHTPEVTRTKG
ncbi:hypothetical protein [Mesohalobacter halotolerans]|uniref:Uncharacterized protein n=1 Tax=Mesohalobacter halotolerans TaxID=1883405 RepID=A0A4U5TQN7_9FLAO|nr:hypothetical protein [Mesohalobacter halotolerans]MBS3737976.1 hypothetical protein [Psychroflexus sp.]TKS56041.1 hypothetical protein FCN74_08425 [Mesohalobacter halotolerans]